MPYQSTQELPASVKDNLPRHAQEIFKEAFNSAYDEYKDSEKRRSGSDQEETAFKVAWAAVKEKYHKDGDDWKAND